VFEGDKAHQVAAVAQKQLVGDGSKDETLHVETIAEKKSSV